MRRVHAVVESLVKKGSSATSSPSVNRKTTPTPPADENNTAKSDTNGTSNGVAPEDKIEAACLTFKAIKLPDRLIADAAHALFATVLKLDESERELGSQLLIKLRSDNLLAHDKLWDGLKQVSICTSFYNMMNDLVSYLNFTNTIFP